MEARTLRFCRHMFFVWFAACAAASAAERFETANFVVVADSVDIAEKVARTAEKQRKELALFWLKKAMPNWSKPCRVSVNVGSIGAGGQTTFQFVNGEVINWRMSVQGSLERILDSVLPHEVNHTIFASYFRRPLPRWADEGAATLFEHDSEQRKQLHLLHQVIHRRESYFALQELLSMKEYPQDPNRMLTLYAQGFTLVDFLVQQKGEATYLQFLADGEELGWEEAIRKHYDHEGVQTLERNWRGWVLAGMPGLSGPDQPSVAQVNEASSDASELFFQDSRTAQAVKPASQRSPKNKALADSVIRSQSPDSEVNSSASTPTAVPALPKKMAIVTAPAGTGAVKQISTSSVSETAVSGQAGPPTFRHRSLEAPRPGTNTDATSKVTSQAPSALGKSAQQSLTAPRNKDQKAGETWFENTTPSTNTPAPQTKSGSRTPRNKIAQPESAPDHFIPTGLSAILPDKDPQTGTEAILSGERRRETNLPQWAGFPGEMKLF